MSFILSFHKKIYYVRIGNRNFKVFNKIKNMEYIMFEFAKEPLALKNVYSDSFKLYKTSFLKTWYLIAITALITFVVGYVNYKYYPVVKIEDFGLLSEKQKAIFAGLTLVDFVASIYFFAIVLCKMHYFYHNTYLQENVFKLVWHRLFSLTIFKLFFIFMMFIGVLVLFIPSIISAVFFLFAFLFIVLEKQGFFRAIASSCKLVYGNWWRTLVAFIPLGIASVCSFGLQMIASKANVDKTALFFVEMLLSIVFLPLMFSFILVQFNDLKLRKAK